MSTNLKKVNQHSTLLNNNVSTNFKPITVVCLLSLLLFVVEEVRGQDRHNIGIPLHREDDGGYASNGSSEQEKVLVGKEAGDGKWYTKMITDSGVVQMGQVDLEDLPITGLSDDQALGLLFQRYRARMMHQHEPRHFGMEELSEREISEICGNSASLECGKKVLKHVLPVASSRDNESPSSVVEQQSQMSVYHRCLLRKEFLECIDLQRKSCRRQADKGIYPRLPPKSIIRSTQSKIWRALWTSGGCTLIN